MDSIIMSTLVTMGLIFLAGGILLVKVEVK
jgi:hypothetical protein